MHLITQRHLSRRTVLRGAGACLALPMLDAMRPALARDTAAGDEPGAEPRRMIAICTDLGQIPEFFFPKETGRDYELSPYLKLIDRHKGDFTVFSGVSHPDVKGGHGTDVSFLTGAPGPTKGGFHNTISLDQYAANHIGHHTRFPTLNLRVGPGAGSLSYTQDGVRIPSENRPSSVYKQLFVQGDPEEVARRVERLREGRSLMDAFGERLTTLKRTVGPQDRNRLDQFLTSVREFEQRLEANEEWVHEPKPHVEHPCPDDACLAPGALIHRSRSMYDLARLAIETDSSRLVTIFVTQAFNPKVDLPGVSVPHHALTHQQSLTDSRQQLRTIEESQTKVLGELLGALKTSTEGEKSLLDRTMVLYGSNLSNAGRHVNTNLPFLLAGGGFRHGQHLDLAQRGERKVTEAPVANIYLAMLQRLGIEADTFASSTGTVTGLEAA